MVLDEFVGQSGNPILIHNKVVGIQSETQNQFSISSAVPFSSERYKIIKGWKEAILAKYNFLKKMEGQQTQGFKDKNITLEELETFKLGR